MADFLPFSKPNISEAAIDEVVDSIRTGWLATGPKVKRFEEAVATYLNAPQAQALTSATGGLQLAMQSLHLQPGDEVITTPITFVATLNTIVQAGGRPVLVDVDLPTYNIDVSRIEAAITPQTRAIMPVHFTGIPVDLDPLYDIAERHQLRVIEDAAHAIGTQYKGKVIGSFGDTQVFSFHPNKVMTTGEGGCVTTRDEDMVRFINTMRFHGIDRDAFNRNSKEGSQHYDVMAPGYKYNMLDIQAALGLHQLARLEEFLSERKRLAKRYHEKLADWPEWTLPRGPNYDHRTTWYIYAPLLNPEAAGMSRDTFMQRMKEHNIGTGYHYQAAHLFTYYQEQYGYRRGQFENAESISDRIVSLPLFPGLSDEEQDRVIETMRNIFHTK